MKRSWKVRKKKVHWKKQNNNNKVKKDVRIFMDIFKNKYII